MTDTVIQNQALQEYLDIEAALEHWRAARPYAPVGCSAAEETAFAAGWRGCLRHLDTVTQARFLVPHDG